jgi:hypothetical protein
MHPQAEKVAKMKTREFLVKASRAAQKRAAVAFAFNRVLVTFDGDARIAPDCWEASDALSAADALELWVKKLLSAMMMELMDVELMVALVLPVVVIS